MNRRSLLASLSAALVFPLASCRLPLPSPGRSVGMLAVIWAEENKSDGLVADAFKHGSSLVRDQAAWDVWVATIPPAMVATRQAELDAVDLASSVVVVAAWSRCQQTSRVISLGDGQLRFEIAEPDPMVNCVWSPRRVEVWLVPLSDADASDRGQVQLLE